MNSLWIVATFALLSCARAFTLQGQANVELDSYWEEFKRAHNKQYDSQFDFVRRLIWESNLKYVQRHNMEHDMGKHSYSLGMNQFADLTHEEFKAMYLSKTPVQPTNGTLFMSPLNVKHLPAALDWRTQGYVTPVKDQGQCGSCWSFSATGSLEGQYFRKNGELVSFSEQQLVDCSKSFGNMGCNGGLMDSAFKYIKQNGIERESDYPYTARDGKCSFNAGKVVTKVTGYVDVPSKNEQKLLEAVATVGPVSVAIDAGHRSFQLYKTGVYDETSCSSVSLDHGVLAIGYGSEAGKDYWIVKNSWGLSWGQQGYIMMSRNKKNQCGIATMASYPLL
jgi:cathepsin L